jgi:hypothetical protein
MPLVLSRPLLSRRKAYLKRAEIFLSAQGLLSIASLEIESDLSARPLEKGCLRLCLQIPQGRRYYAAAPV